MSQYPNTSPYGDKWESDDSVWSEGTSNIGPQPPNNRQHIHQPNLPSEPALGQFDNTRFSQTAAPPVNPMSNLTITQDDILFMRRVRTDCFYYRVIPITTVGFTALYLYNKSKKLPLTFGKFIGVGLASMIIGIRSYKSEFESAITEAPVDTPYLRAIRTRLNLPYVGRRDGYSSRASDDLSTWSDSETTTEPKYPMMTDTNLTTGFNPDYANQPIEPGNQGSEPPVITTTYDELRARNRGYIK